MGEEGYQLDGGICFSGTELVYDVDYFSSFAGHLHMTIGTALLGYILSGLKPWGLFKRMRILFSFDATRA